MMRVNMMAVVLAALAAGLAAPTEAGDVNFLQTLPVAQDILETKAEISLLNLLNGLYLSEEQVDGLIPLAERAVEVRKSYLESLDEAGAAYLCHLEAFRDASYRASGSTPDERRAIVQEEVVLEIGPRDEAAEELGRLEDEARDLLTDAQVAIIEEFKPCLVPPKNLADPVAVGQASTTAREEAALDIVRRMPDALYAERREAVVEAIVRNAEVEKRVMPDDVRERMVDTYLEKLDAVRGMTEVDFDVHKRDLAESFQMFDDDVTYHKGHTRETGAISRHFLNQTGARVLREWRVARANDLPETPGPDSLELAPEFAGMDPRVRKGVLQFGRQAYRLLEERLRAGLLDDTQAEALRDELLTVRNMEAPERQFETILGVCDVLNRLAVTPASVDIMFGKVAGLAHLKRVPGIMVPARHPHFKEDVTGLRQYVQEARELRDAGRFDEAYATLTDVAVWLEAFKA